MTLYSEEMDVAYCVVMNFLFFLPKLHSHQQLSNTVTGAHKM